MAEIKPQNRRRGSRVYCAVPLTCEVTDPRSKTVNAYSFFVKNMSSDGLYFECEFLIDLQTEIKCKFILPENNQEINAIAKITRVEVIEGSKLFGIGAFFTKIDDKDRELIRQMIDRYDINKLLEIAVKKNASDLHLLANQKAVLRINGELQAMETPIYKADEIYKMIFSLMSKQQIRAFEKQKELDFGIQFDANNRFRVNVHQQRGFTEAVLRLINSRIASFDELQIPEEVKSFIRHKDGLVLVIGPTGSGKTTTIAAMVNLINQERKAVVITLERPIEYMHVNDKCIIKQREVGTDTYSFSEALKSSLRQDPNIIVVGEMEDLETVKTALLAAEAGYLVIASFHAPDTLQAIDRLVSIFPAENRKQVLAQFSHCLRGIITQMLIPRSDKRGRFLATEVLTINEAVKKVIRNDELIQLRNMMQTGSGAKMRSFAESLKQCFEQGIIDGETYEWYALKNS